MVIILMITKIRILKATITTMVITDKRIIVLIITVIRIILRTLISKIRIVI